jgi:copper chaperone CopZ
MVEARQSGNRELRSGSKTIKGALWLITALAVGTATFPNWPVLLLSSALPAATANAGTIALAISGMSCSACAVSIEKSLKKVPGVEAASVDFDRAEALVVVERGETLKDALLEAVSAAGEYRAQVK